MPRESTVSASRVFGWTDVAVRAVAAGYFFVMLGLLFWGTVPAVIGWRTTLVIGDSMGPTVRKGDLLVTAPVRPASVSPGQVIVFDWPTGGPYASVAHRVVGRDADGDLLTKGDANAEADSTPVTASAVRGLARLVIPKIGKPVLWLREGRYAPLGLWCGGTVLASWLAFRGTGTNVAVGARPSADPALQLAHR